MLFAEAAVRLSFVIIDGFLTATRFRLWMLVLTFVPATIQTPQTAATAATENHDGAEE